MLYEVCYRALSSIFVVEATHGRVARVAGVVLLQFQLHARPARPPSVARRRSPLGARRALIDQSISDWLLHSTP